VPFARFCGILANFECVPASESRVAPSAPTMHGNQRLLFPRSRRERATYSMVVSCNLLARPSARWLYRAHATMTSHFEGKYSQRAARSESWPLRIASMTLLLTSGLAVSCIQSTGDLSSGPARPAGGAGGSMPSLGEGGIFNAGSSPGNTGGSNSASGGALGGGGGFAGGGGLAGGGGGSAGGSSCATAELCNGADDNCDGVVDEGCGFTVTWSAGADLLALGESPGGIAFNDACATGDILVGFRVNMNGWLTGLGAVCQTVSILPDAKKSPPYKVALRAQTDLAFHLTDDPHQNLLVETVLCPDGYVVSSVGALPHTDDLTKARYLVQFSLTCSLPVVGGSVGSLVLQLSPTGRTVPANSPVLCGGCSPENGLTRFIEQGQLPTRLTGASAEWVDRFAIGQSQALITPK